MAKSKQETYVVRYILEEKVQSCGDRVYAIWGDEHFTYAQINERVNRVANSFLDLGVKKGDTVLLFMPNRKEYLFTWFGLSKIGAVEVPINNAYRGNLLKYIVNNAESRIMVVHQSFLDRVQAIQGELEHLEKLIILADGPDIAPPQDLRFKTLPFSKLLEGSIASPPDPGIQHYDLMAILYTSGTTGPSKGVMVPYAQVYATMGPSIKHYGANDIYYNPFPMFHVSGQYPYYTLMVVGGCVVGREVFSISSFWEDIDRYKCTCTLLLSSMVPFVYNQPRREDDAQHSLNKVLMVPLIDEVEDFKERFGVQVQTCFNMTEISTPICSDGFNLVNNKSCGRTRLGAQVRIVDEHDEEVSPHQIGELVVRTDEPWTMNAGYWKMPEKTAEAWRNQWLHTGDGFYRDEDGNYYFVDRLKDAIRRRGENISSFEVESEINSHPAVLECAAIAVPSEFSEDEIKAIVVLHQGKKVEPEELVRYLEPRMPYFMVPRYIEFVKELPKTPTEKVRKQVLREVGVNENTWDMVKAGIKLKK
ncbi:MAG: AMP-binding protein [Candidatus Tectomicrobia bacterium]|uniref:AMP-binding protein n=1 Tax=Tectimicrobiota bacterium TaxID=2528274 RepID=A0A933GN73_UNCTE|nr:AMP-binding protein [Candidatus Tectomicrobia bacterium]